MGDVAILRSVTQSLISLSSTFASVQEPLKSIHSLLLEIHSFETVLGPLTQECSRASEKFGNLKPSLKQLGKEIAKCETIINENRLSLETLETQLDSQIEKIHVYVSAIQVEFHPR